MLKDLSNTFPEVWVKVVDTDGEFLLIEAANALPRWLNPEIADNRVGPYSMQTPNTILTIAGLDSSEQAPYHPSYCGFCFLGSHPACLSIP